MAVALTTWYQSSAMNLLTSRHKWSLILFLFFRVHRLAIIVKRESISPHQRVAIEFGQVFVRGFGWLSFLPHDDTVGRHGGCRWVIKSNRNILPHNYPNRIEKEFLLKLLEKRAFCVCHENAKDRVLLLYAAPLPKCGLWQQFFSRFLSKLTRREAMKNIFLFIFILSLLQRGKTKKFYELSCFVKDTRAMGK